MLLQIDDFSSNLITLDPQILFNTCITLTNLGYRVLSLINNRVHINVKNSFKIKPE